MAKDKSEKKEKKEKRQSVDGVKKEKKEKRDRKSTDTTATLLDTLEDASAVDADGDVTIGGAETNGQLVKTDGEIPLAALVPFANPLCDEKSGKKVLKTVKKGKRRPLKTGTTKCLANMHVPQPQSRNA